MTFGKASLLGLALASAFALGLAVAPSVRDVDQSAPAVTATAAPASEAAPVAGRTAARASRTARVSASAADVHAHVKPLLNKGADMTLASDGFRDAEQFAMVAHAARNTEIPFVLLKHRVLTEGKSLASAIEQSKPDLDAKIEADRARAEARSDMARLRG